MVLSVNSKSRSREHTKRGRGRLELINLPRQIPRHFIYLNNNLSSRWHVMLAATNTPSLDPASNRSTRTAQRPSRPDRISAASSPPPSRRERLGLKDGDAAALHPADCGLQIALKPRLSCNNRGRETDSGRSRNSVRHRRIFLSFVVLPWVVREGRTLKSCPSLSLAAKH